MILEGPGDIAADAYVYAFPLVCMELTRRGATNVSAPSPSGRAPMNQFAHREAFADPSAARAACVSRPSVDTISSMMWFDVAREPIVIALPDLCDRYVVIELFDMWTDVFASIGTRTTGASARRITLADASWPGARALESSLVRSSTSRGWVVAHFRAGGRDELDAVHELQQAIRVAPLSASAQPFTWPQAAVNNRPATAGSTNDQIETMSVEQFFAVFADAMQASQPHANDQPILERMRCIGLEPGRRAGSADWTPEMREAVEAAGPAARQRIKRAAARPDTLLNGWRMNAGSGTYGTHYLRRAAMAYVGLGAPTPEDAVCPTAFNDEDGMPLQCGCAYTLHFAADELPPVRAFWSLTMYDHRQNLAANPIDRYALCSEDPIVYNADGSLDLYLQRHSPGDPREANWLPTPEEGPFTMTLRLYWPTNAVIDGQWQPPRIRRVSR